MASLDSFSDLIGAWELVDCTDFNADGTQGKPLGQNPSGQIMYSTDGHMSAHLICGSAPSPDAVPYIGYFGRFSVDDASRVVTHHVAGASQKDMVGTDLKRSFSLEGVRLTLEASRPNGLARVYWQRTPSRGS